MGRVIAAAVVIAAPLVACSLNLDDLSGGIIVFGDAGQLDSSANAINGDASIRSNGQDAAPLDDASPEAALSTVDAADAGSDAGALDAAFDGPWCLGQPGHTLCSDFDEGTLAYDYSTTNAQWNVVGSPLLSIDGGETSFPGALYASVFETTNPDAEHHSAIQSGVGSSIVTVHVEFDLRLNFTLPINGNDTSMSIVTITDGTEQALFHGLSFGVGTAGMFIAQSYAADAGSGNVTRTLPPLPGVWSRVGITQTRANPGHINVTYNGATEIDSDFTVLSAGTVGTSLSVGLEALGVVNPGLSVSVDDVTVDMQ